MCEVLTGIVALALAVTGPRAAAPAGDRHKRGRRIYRLFFLVRM